MILLKLTDQFPFMKRFDPEGKSFQYQLALTAVTFVALVLAGACLGLVGLYFSAGVYKLPLFSYYLRQPKLVLLNTVPYVLLCLLVWFVTNRAWVGFFASGFVCLFYSFAAYWKLLARDDALYAEDLTLIQEALQMSGGHTPVTWQMVAAVCLVLGGTAVLFCFFRGKMPHWTLRLLLPFAVVGLCLQLYNGPYTSKEVYQSFQIWPQLNKWFESSRYLSRGGIYPFIYSIQDAVPTAPEGYDADAAAGMLLEEDSDGIPEDQKVSVICVMYEAFCDLSKETELITEADPYEAYHALQAESYCGELTTNIFAGGTIDTERCVLTGFSELTNFRRDSWSYARYFADQGYAVEGSHAGYQAFYSRLNVNDNLGISDYHFIENYYQNLVSGVPMDNVLLPEISRLALEKMEAGENVFSFNVTYQNHGPYSTTLGKSAKEYVALGDLSTGDHAIVNNYLTGIEDTCRQMAAMVDTFRDRDEPVVLVFFGDHKPWLGELSSTYAALGIDINASTDESFYNHYNTDYLIWANDAARELLGNDFVGIGPTISPCFLMNVLFEQCGWAGPSYMKLTNQVMEAMPVVTTNDSFLVDGALVTEDQLSDANKALLSRMRQTQFYLAQDAGGKLPE